MGIELLRNNFIDHTDHTVANPAPNLLFTHITTGIGNNVTEYGLNQFATDGDYGTAADVNDDGWVDIFMRKRDENDFVLNQGGSFSNGAELGQAANNNKGGNGLWDLDNDGDLDAVWIENGQSQILRNDGDENPNHLDDDSDGDGCNDADEAYADSTADLDSNGMYGSASPAVNANGSVIAATYDKSADGDGNGDDDFLQVTATLVVTDQPQNQTVSKGEDAIFISTVNNADTFQWQVSIDGVNYTNLENNSEYSGTETSTLTVLNVSKLKEGYSYRLLASNSSNMCAEIVSNAALLFVKVRTVITNRRITYRVKAN
ncbi:VCBS repeat-containing protein [Maribacter sp. SA7]|uniref:FG-GAP repeat domain-containing protein n=1 Tax=Maribacter zhoushanensis TaxID=3030012 RepID=UPI0023EBB728|nr:VCBS repeat-containing protein [Maribacter zhoushanensis]MDF4204567.1 VCBS repeat-containing protein [Maribacter zhoushanensis]